jgi:hypothetical protein
MNPETPSTWLVAPVLPVVVVDGPDADVLVAGAFQEAGLQQIEITPRAPASLKPALQAIASALPPARHRDLDFIPTGGRDGRQHDQLEGARLRGRRRRYLACPGFAGRQPRPRQPRGRRS